MDDFDVIETPENVGLERRLAGIGSRSLAGLLDHLILAALLAAVIVLLLLMTGFSVGIAEMSDNLIDQAGTLVMGILILIVFLIYWGYFLAFEMWTNGQTPGKKYMRIRVVRVEGGAITFSAVAIRNLLRALDAIGGYAVGGVTMFLTRKSQRLGDLAAGTVVISEELPNYAAKADSRYRVVDDTPAPAAALKATRLSPREYQLLRNYWIRRDQLTVEARCRLLPQLLGPILERSGMPLAQGSLPEMEQELEEIMKQAITTELPEPPGHSEGNP